MRTRRRATIQELRQAIDCLPATTRTAMLDGIRSNEIIVGAYTDGDGVCPMLAAHRAGGRTNFIGFAKAWDRFAFTGSRVRLARRATDREVLILKTHLEASLLADEGPAPDLAAAMAEHRDLLARRDRAAASVLAARRASREAEPQSGGSSPRPGDPDRTNELRAKPGWAWMRVFRRYDDYERALARVHAQRDALEEHREHELV
jgi:hypothetical protein